MERIKTKITPNTAALFVVIYTAFYLVGSLVMIGIVFGFDLDIRNFWVSQSGTFVIQIALLLAFVFISFKLFYKPWDILKSDYGTVIGKDSKSKLKIALIYVVSTVVVVAMLFALNPVISMFSDAMTAIGFGEAKPDDVSIFAWSIGVDTMLWYHFIIMVFVMGVLPAVAEEVVFRGLLIEKLKGFGFWAIVLMSSFLFMTLHGNIFQSIYQFLLGVICAIAYLKTRDIKVPILMHLANNVAVIINLYIINSIYGANPPSEELTTPFILTAVGMAVLGLGLIAAYYFFISRITKTEKSVLTKPHTYSFPNLECEKPNTDNGIALIMVMIGASAFWVINVMVSYFA